MTSTKTIKVCGQTFTLTFPTVGQFIDIKVLEVKLSQGFSAQMVTGTADQLDAFLFITTYAHFSVLCPELMRQLKVSDLRELSISDFEELSKVYLSEIQPWIVSVKSKMKQGMINAH